MSENSNKIDKSDPLKILIVDDEIDLVGIIASEFEAIGYQTVTANNGQQALEIMNDVAHGKLWIDAIISDINMPKMSGLVFLNELRQLGLETPFVFFSGYGDKEKTLEALRLGAIDFLEKPYDPDLLIKSVSRAAEMGRQMRDIDKEVSELCKKHNIKPEELDGFKAVQRAMLKFKKMNKVYFDKK